MDAAMRRSDIRCLTIRPTWVQWEGNYERNLGPVLRDPEGERRASACGPTSTSTTSPTRCGSPPSPSSTPTRSSTSPRPDNSANRPLAELDPPPPRRRDRDPRAAPPPRRLRAVDREGASGCSATPRRAPGATTSTEDGTLLDAAARAPRARRHRRPARARGRLGGRRRDRSAGPRPAGARWDRRARPRRPRPGRASRPRAARATSDSSFSRCSVSSARDGLVALLDDPLDLLVDQPLRVRRDLGRAGQQRAARLGGQHGDRADRLAHPPAAHHRAGDPGQLLDVGLRAGGDRPVDELLRDAAAERDLDLRRAGSPPRSWPCRARAPRA